MSGGRATKPGWLRAVTGGSDRNVGVRSGLDTDLSSRGRNENRNTGVQLNPLLQLSPHLPHVGEVMGMEGFPLQHSSPLRSSTLPTRTPLLFTPRTPGGFPKPSQEESPAPYTHQAKATGKKISRETHWDGKLIGKGAPMSSAEATTKASEGNPNGFKHPTPVPCAPPRTAHAGAHTCCWMEHTASRADAPKGFFVCAAFSSVPFCLRGKKIPKKSRIPTASK